MWACRSAALDGGSARGVAEGVDRARGGRGERLLDLRGKQASGSVTSASQDHVQQCQWPGKTECNASTKASSRHASM